MRNFDWGDRIVGSKLLKEFTWSRENVKIMVQFKEMKIWAKNILR